MTHEEIEQWCEQHISEKTLIEFPEELFQSLDSDTAVSLSQRYGAHHLMVLPKREQEFFSWLRMHDEAVWNDLWSHTEEQPYIVSLAFLPALLDPSRGFPICDLEQVDNYFFVPALLNGENAKDFVEAVRERFLAQQKVTVEQLLALECSLSPIDIWHFAWHHDVELARAKQAVHSLVEDQILRHLKSSHDLAEFID